MIRTYQTTEIYCVTIYSIRSDFSTKARTFLPKAALSSGPVMVGTFGTKKGASGSSMQADLSSQQHNLFKFFKIFFLIIFFAPGHIATLFSGAGVVSGTPHLAV